MVPNDPGGIDTGPCRLSSVLHGPGVAVPGTVLHEGGPPGGGIEPLPGSDSAEEECSGSGCEVRPGGGQTMTPTMREVMNQFYEWLLRAAVLRADEILAKVSI